MAKAPNPDIGSNMLKGRAEKGKTEKRAEAVESDSKNVWRSMHEELRDFKERVELAKKVSDFRLRNGGENACDKLKEDLNDCNPRKRLVSVVYLAKKAIDYPEQLEYVVSESLIGAYKTEDEDMVRAEIVRSMGNVARNRNEPLDEGQSEKLIEFIGEVMNDSSWLVRKNGIEALCGHRIEGAESLLFSAMAKDSNPEVQAAAAIAIGKGGYYESFKHLEFAFANEGDRKVRDAIMLAMLYVAQDGGYARQYVEDFMLDLVLQNNSKGDRRVARYVLYSLTH